MGGGVLPAPDARPVHDAAAHRRTGWRTRSRCGPSPTSAAEFGTPMVDITTRQQVQLRGFGDRARAGDLAPARTVGVLVSLQTGMDNIRNVIGCAVAGLTPARAVRRLADRARSFTELFVGNKAFTNLPRKFNVGDHRLHRALHPRRDAGSGADAGDANVERRKAARLQRRGRRQDRIGRTAGSRRRSTCSSSRRTRSRCAARSSGIFRDYGSRAARNEARLAFLVEEWGVERFRRELEQRHVDVRSIAPARMPGRSAAPIISASSAAEAARAQLRRSRGTDRTGFRGASARRGAGRRRRTGTAISGSRRAEHHHPEHPGSRLARWSAEPVLQRSASRSALALRGAGRLHRDRLLSFLIDRNQGTRGARRRDYLGGAAAGRPRAARPTGRAAPPAAAITPARTSGCSARTSGSNGEMVEAVDVFVGGSIGPEREGRHQGARGRALRRAAGGARARDPIRERQARRRVRGAF